MFKVKKEIARGFDVQVEADPVLSPTVVYGEPMTAIFFEDENGRNCRITFENLDSIRICRGEYCPYGDDRKDDDPYYWVSKVENSSWLVERHKYESEHYNNSYGFGGDVDEMLNEFSHYLFSFHDQYVEVLAAGIWIEKSEEPLNGTELSDGHPFLALSHEHSEVITAHGLTCHIWKNLTDITSLIENAKYCSQPLLEFAPELDGSITTSIYLSLKYRNGDLCSILTQSFAGEIACFKGVASVELTRPYIEKWLGEVSERRREIGK